MSAIKLHLEHAEYDAVCRFASAAGVSPEDLLYTALNRLMLAADKAEIHRDVAETREWRRNNLPLWSDSAGSVHAYEGKPDDEPAPSRYV
ncbi:hypothetical protein [Opitutus sp. ER46]|uniref:hypothetical protein n=1 Tax=Opitutus sp. ER46 TaxID=2161864 RepID=UPI000D31EBC9|nr:hypothetical protein [Opitutus sp. ER46]PTX98608.1 hypothetical protein DB354_04915 [Opitutus sp. ER46]